MITFIYYNIHVVFIMTRWRIVRISEENYLKLKGACRAEFVNEHPEFKDYHTSMNFMLCKVIDYYLKS